MRPATAILLVLALGGCGALVDRAVVQFGNDLEAAILDYEDPATVGEALPAYLLLMESRVTADPDNAGARLTTARLTSTYASLFAEDRERARTLHGRALEHARTAVCARGLPVCPEDLPRGFPAFERAVAEIGDKDVATAYIYASTWTSWIEAHSDDYGALADLPRVEMLLERLGELRPEHDDGALWLYLGVLNSQRPPAAGGQPDKARAYFNKAETISRGRNLLVPLYLADSYARLVFDRELYVSQLERVLESDPEQPGFTLVNHIAQQRARELLEETDEIF